VKPLLILGPSPARWPAVAQLLGHEESLWLEDLRRRLVDGVDGSHDAFAAIPDGGQMLAGAGIRRRHDIGVLGHLFTRPEHRGRGYARLLMQALLSWFDMSGGKWLYLTTPAELAGGLFEKFGFRALCRSPQADGARATMLRKLGHTADSPFDKLSGPLRIRDASRADWALLVALLQHRKGADPRVPLAESALTAERTALELLTQQEQGVCHLRLACCQERIVGVGSIAKRPGDKRTYAVLFPHDDRPEGLREAVLEYARVQGYEQVDFPMEALQTAAGDQGGQK